MMDAKTITSLVKNIGLTLNELMAKELLLNGFKPKSDGAGWLILKPSTGIELNFWEETGVLEKVLIALIPLVEGSNKQTYKGELPHPFTLNMDKASVRELLGDPLESRGEFKMPLAGMVGGWDAYPLRENTNANVRVHFSYNANMKVRTLGFILSDTGHI